jgi:hypothetical protein
MKDDVCTLLFSGDFAPLIEPENISAGHFKGIDNLLNDCDLHITNLECPLTESRDKIPKTGPNIKADPKIVNLLSLAKVNVACMANNHIFDFGEQGICDTINVCEENGIATIGIVNRKDEKQHWLIKEVKGKKIGFINYCEHEFSVRDEGLTGANGYDAVNAFYEIRVLKPQVDFLIVIYHGGNEYYPLPNPQLKKDFHYLADLGADAVIGHHTHVFSGYEIYRSKPLVYSLGNFFFPFPGEPEEWHTAVICTMSIGSDISIELHPVLQCKNNANVLLIQGASKNAVNQLIEKYSVTIANDAALENSWKNYVMKKQRGYLKQITGAGFVAKVLLKLGFNEDKIFNKTQITGLYNLINCRAHYEVVKASLKFKL